MYFKLLEIFILKILFSKNEYDITSKKFNSIKVFTVIVIVSNLTFTVYLLDKINSIYIKIKTECPSMLVKNKK